MSQSFSNNLLKLKKLQKNWNEWQLELNSVQEKQQTLTDQRHQYQQKDEQLREQLEAKRLAWQAAKSDREHYQEQLKDLNAELQKGLQIDLAEHQQKLEKVQKQFEKNWSS